MSDAERRGYLRGLKDARRLVAESFESQGDTDGKGVYRVVMTRTLKFYVEMEADSLDDAIEQCEIRVSVNENGELKVPDYGTKGSIRDSITEHGILDRGNDEVVYDECEDVSDQYEEIPDGE